MLPGDRIAKPFCFGKSDLYTKSRRSILAGDERQLKTEGSGNGSREGNDI